jgi:hypothetical protein
MAGSTAEAYHFFSDCGARYRSAYLAGIDVACLRDDRDYGVKHFLFRWAFERAGAPRAFRVAAIKAFSSVGQDRSEVSHLFARFCTGKTNPKVNPVLDPRIAELDVPSIVRDVERGAIEAFGRLALNGLGHKLRAFFLRDLVCILDVEARLALDLERHVWCQPNRFLGALGGGTARRVPDYHSRHQSEGLPTQSPRLPRSDDGHPRQFLRWGFAYQCQPRHLVLRIERSRRRR